MATQTVRVQISLPAGTYHVDVQAGTSVANVYSGVSLVPTANPAFWTFAVTAATSGLYSFTILTADDDIVGYGWFYSDTDEAVTLHDSNTADGALMESRLSQIPQVGKTFRYTRTARGPLQVDVEITDPT